MRNSKFSKSDFDSDSRTFKNIPGGVIMTDPKILIN